MGNKRFYIVALYFPLSRVRNTCQGVWGAASAPIVHALRRERTGSATGSKGPATGITVLVVARHRASFLAHIPTSLYNNKGLSL